MACKCYHAERNFVWKIGVCWGTKECEACSCGGDESKCDFYEDKRKKATPKTTNADRIRAMTDEELAEVVNDIFYGLNENPGMCDVCDNDSIQNCKQCWLNWLRQEATL